MLMTHTFRYRTIWISDVHLGTKGCQAELLLDFLKHTESDTLYLVGDMIDGWRLKSAWYWPQAHNDVVQKLLRKARKGTRVIYVPGNHDEFARAYINHQFGGVVVQRHVMHRTADGRRLLVMHGDELDAVIQSAKWLAFLGDWAYRLALFLNIYFNAFRPGLGLQILVAVRLSEIQGQERGRPHRQVRGTGGRLCARAGRRRRGLRPHPPPGGAGGGRPALCQRWRLGRELHCPGGA